MYCRRSFGLEAGNADAWVECAPLGAWTLANRMLSWLTVVYCQCLLDSSVGQGQGLTLRVFSNCDVMRVIIPNAAIKDRRDSTCTTTKMHNYADVPATAASTLPTYCTGYTLQTTA